MTDTKEKPARRRVGKLFLMANGQFAAYDTDGNGIAELSMRTAIELWAEYAHDAGFDPVGCQVLTQLPGGEGSTCTIDGNLGDFFERWD